MSDQWMFESRTFGNCNCDVNCGCQFEQTSTHGSCHAFFAGTVVNGHFNDTTLSGLNWVFIAKFPGEIPEGNGARQIIIEERADANQRAALEKIIGGESCAPMSNHFSVFNSMCTEFHDTLYMPIDIDLDIENRKAAVNIPGVAEGYGKPILDAFSGEPFHVALARPSGSFEFSYAEIGLGTTTVTSDVKMAFKDTYAQFCVHHYDQDGLVHAA